MDPGANSGILQFPAAEKADGLLLRFDFGASVHATKVRRTIDMAPLPFITCMVQVDILDPVDTFDLFDSTIRLRSIPFDSVFSRVTIHYSCLLACGPCACLLFALFALTHALGLA